MNGYPSFYPRIALVAPSPGQHQAIIWTDAGLLLIEHLGANFSHFFYLNFIDKSVFETDVGQSGAHLVPASMC